MFRQHQLRPFTLDLWPLPNPTPWDPPLEFVRGRIAQSLREDNILKDLNQEWGGIAVGEITLTVGALCMIRDLWRRHAYAESRPSEGIVPPKIPLRCFTHRLNVSGKGKVDVEIYPGVDSWEEMFEEKRG